MKKITRMMVLAFAMVMTLGLGMSVTAEAKTKGSVTSVQITKPTKKSTYTIKRGAKDKTVKLKYTVKVKNGASKKVTFKSSNSKVVSVSSDGVLTAKKAGKAKITVTSVQNKKKKDTITVTVKQLVTGIQPSVKKAVATWNDGKNVTLKVGGKGYAISNKFTGAKPSSKAVTYKSSKKSVLTVNSKGKITAKKAGKAKITVTAKDGSKKKATITVKVLPKSYTKVKSVTVTPETLELNVVNKKTAQLTATVAPKNAKYKTVAYTSSNEKVATVDNKGNVKAVGVGEATITVKSVDGSKKQDTVKVVVKNDINAIAFTAKEASVFVGDTTTVKATVNADAYDTTVTYAIDAASQKVATVDAKTGVVKGLARGTVTVTAKAANGKTASMTVKVTDKVVTKVTPKTGTAAVTTVTFEGNKADVQSDIVAALKIAKAAEGTKKAIKLDGVDKVLVYENGTVTVDGTELKDTKTTTGEIKVQITEKMVDFVKGLQVAQFAGKTYNYTVTIGKHTFTQLTVAQPYMTVKEGSKTYTAYVENGALYFVGTPDLQDLADKGIADITVIK